MGKPCKAEADLKYFEPMQQSFQLSWTHHPKGPGERFHSPFGCSGFFIPENEGTEWDT